MRTYPERFFMKIHPIFISTAILAIFSCAFTASAQMPMYAPPASSFYAPPPPPHRHSEYHRYRTYPVREIPSSAVSYSYTYYPSQQVYYSPRGRVWFWNERGEWRSGKRLPRVNRLQSDPGIAVMLRTDRPYTQHVYVEHKYGHPWRKRHHNHPR